MRKRTLLLCAVGLVLVSSPSWARLWSNSRILVDQGFMFQCGETPSIALLYGVQPVVSNYRLNGGLRPTVVHQTPFGWEAYDIPAGYIAGNGNKAIVSSIAPVAYGQDGHFYTTSRIATPDSSGLYPITLDGGVGPRWPYATNAPFGFVSSDPSGAIYMAMGSQVARSAGAAWSKPLTLSLLATDIAVSAFGDIAVSGRCNTTNAYAVSWFDYKSGTWEQRALTSTSSNPYNKVDVEWDKLGNLGVAYTDAQCGNVMFDYLDMATGTWTTEAVNKEQRCGLLGAALAFDRFGNPVIASGDTLFYDPAPVPEPSAIVTLLSGAAGLVFKKKRSA